MAQRKPVDAPALDQAVLASAHAQWASDGYAFVEGGLPRELCEGLAQKIFSEFDRQVAGKQLSIGGVLSGHLNCLPGVACQPLVDAVEASGLTRFVSEALGMPVTLSEIGCNANLPGSRYQNFHTDSDWRNPFVIVNIGLVDTDRANGSTELVAGSQEPPLRYWEFVAKGLASKSIRAPMKPGDVLIRPSTLWHRGTPNRSQRMRPMLGLVYSVARPDSKPFDYYEHGGGMVFIGNRFGGDLKGRLTEMFCVYLPWARAMLRFGKSFLAPVGQAS